MSFERSFGILLPVFSLPGSGTLDDAGAFVEFLADAGASIWQVLPLGPTHEDGSPYLALSTHATNPALLGHRQLEAALGDEGTLAALFARHGDRERNTDAYLAFANAEADWLQEFALYVALREKFEHRPWFEWPDKVKHRDPATLTKLKAELTAAIDFTCWQQFHFFNQWQALKATANAAGIKLFGDLPLYVAHDSADAWQYPDLFTLNSDGTANSVAGVPPDYFAPTGQRWGNPIYDWERHAETGYAWWIRRMQTQASLYDIVRIDHFRGLESYWEVPGDAPTAETGEWRAGPGSALLDALQAAIPDLTLVAEDLGTITEAVDELREAYQLPGIRVLHFGFDGMHDNPHAPENIEANAVLYTGTHDNDTSVGWYQALPDWQRDTVDAHMAGHDLSFPRSFIACVFATDAHTVIVPMQDLLGLGPEARINTPGTMGDNWCWQMPGDWSTGEVVDFLQELAANTDRSRT